MREIYVNNLQLTKSTNFKKEHFITKVNNLQNSLKKVQIEKKDKNKQFLQYAQENFNHDKSRTDCLQKDIC